LSEGFLKLIHLPEAVARLLGALPEREPEAEEIDPAAALGRVLAADLFAPEDLPGFERSTMDGYAVRAADTYGASEALPAYLELVGEVPMGAPAGVEVGPGQVVAISTGGVLPDTADAVIMVENTELSGNMVEVVKGVAPGDNTVKPDEDVARGAFLFGKGQVLGPAQIGALVGLGITIVEVNKRPLVAILATGDELVTAGETPGPGQVRDINTAALSAAVMQEGCEVRACGIVSDDFELLLAASREALAGSDALIISGGSSAGMRDLTVDILGALGEPGVLAHGLYLKPGKPTLIAVCGGKPVLGLPGNPASALAVFREVVVPLLEHLKGEAPGPSHGVARTVDAIMERSVSSATGRLELVPVSLKVEGDALIASPVLGKASLIGTLARAHGQVRVPEGKEGLEQGERVTVELLLE
jgi:molybdopterin molybdotransferase